ncbi:FAD-dependent oxidoreductase (plasmid) [Ochrobactrum sp. MT180101]|nr:FAD-dependent oxidoreductase [Ochrobactrum sp. MT180101]
MAHSQWLHDVRENIDNYPIAAGDLKLDIAVIGGGFVGLWTSIFIKQLEPNARVAVFEKDQVGHGASGLNGGFLMTWWPKLASLRTMCGTDDALWLADQTTESVSAIGEFLRDNDIDADFTEAGWIWAATLAKHAGSWNGIVDLCRKLGRDSIFDVLEQEDVARRTGSSIHVAGVLERRAGTVHPGKLVAGLARVARKLGVTIYEDSPVLHFTRTSPSVLQTSRARIACDKVILATNAWTTEVSELSPYLFNIASSVIATEKIPDLLEKIGWTGGESTADSQSLVNYYRTTRDGRIIFGQGGGSVLYSGNSLSQKLRFDRDIANTISDFNRIYPMLRDVVIDKSWSGPIDRSYNGLPLLGRLQSSPNILYGFGWSGNGVNPSRVGGRILAGLALDRKEQWTENGLVNAKARRFPPRLIGYLGGTAIRSALARKDVAEKVDKPMSAVDRMLVKLAPAGLEDKIE